MARFNGPRNKIARRLGQDLGLKVNPKSLERRINTLPGQHGRKGKGKTSDYGMQLAEKQKAKHTYGVLERQFRQYYKVASRTREATGAALLSLLERRLDNVVYRLALAPTRRAARQLVSHGNVQVDGSKVSVPSYRVRVDEVVTISKSAIDIPYIKVLLENKDFQAPEWLEKKGVAGRVKRLPERQDITENINEQLIVEYYSR